MLLPSKELLSEVCGENVKDVELWENNSIRYFAPKDYILNIYELAHKCKEWALSKGYDIYSDCNGSDVCNIGSNYSIAPFHHNVTEPEAIFKACEWIMEQTR